MENISPNTKSDSQEKIGFLSSYFILTLALSATAVFFLRGIFFQGISHPAPYFAFLLLIPFFYYLTITVKGLIFLLLFLFSCVFVFFQDIYLGLNYGLINELGRFSYPFFAIFVLIFYLDKKPVLIVPVIYFSMFFLSLDTLYRIFIANDFINLFASDRYLIKGGGLIFMDSNFGATLAAFIYFIAPKYIKNTSSLFNLRILCLLLILISKSLAVIYTFVFVLIFGRLVQKFSLWQLLLSLALLFAVIGITGFLDDAYFLVNDFDGSGGSKVMIIIESIQVLLSENFNILVGVGLGNFINYANVGSHNFLGLFIELGLIGFILMILPLLVAWRVKENRNSIFLIILTGWGLYPITYMALPILCLFVDKIGED